MTAAPVQQLAGAPVAIPLRGYQRESIEDRKHVQVEKWCRQSGKDFTTSLKAVLRGLDKRHRGDWLIGSLTQRQADLTHEKAAMHARAITEVMCPESEEEFEANIGGKYFRFVARTIVLPNGRKIISLPGRDPDSWAGYTANIIITEFALFPGGGEKHWRTMTPIAFTNGLDVYAISTPRSKDTRFYKLCQNKKGRYSVRVVDIHRAVRDGLILRDEDGEPCGVEEFKEIYDDPVGWEREYLVRETDDLDALIRWPDVEAAYEAYDIALLDLKDDRGYDSKTENVFAARLLSCTGRLTCGWDVARRRDLSTFWINEQVGKRQWLRALVIMRRCSFQFQREGMIEQAMDTLRGMVGCGDSTGLGIESNERLEKKYGLRWRGVTFTGGSKLALASRLQTTYQDGGQAIPQSAEIVAYDLHALQKETRGDKILIHEMQNALEPDSHCDIAYANALALEAAQLQFARPYCTTWN